MLRPALRHGSLFVLSLAVVAGMTACGAKLGDPQPPTSSQMQAQTQLTTSTDQINTLGTKPDSTFALYGTMSGIGPLAVDMSAKKTSGLGGDGSLVPQDLPPGCYTGDAATGYTYKDCKNGDTTINGTVKIAGQTTTIDLTVASSSQGTNAKITLSGAITNTGSHISGALTYKIAIDLGAFGGLAGGAGNITTVVTYDMGYTSSPACINSGTIRVDYNQSGYSGVAEFNYTGCNMYKVRNG